MTKKGFTLMELLVSIFITGMVMLSLVAMWKTSSNHTVQAQRQAIVKNENTIFLRTFYNDFVQASDVICPNVFPNIICDNYKNRYVAITNAVIDPTDSNAIVRLTHPDTTYCNAQTGWGDSSIINDIEMRCIKPSVVVYEFKNSGIYKCRAEFLDGEADRISMTDFSNVVANCSGNNNKDDIILPYVDAFSITVPTAGSGSNEVIYPELFINYTVKKTFTSDVPPIYFQMRRYFVRKNGV